MKQKTYSGVGISSMLHTSKQHNLTNLNSRLHIKNPNDLDSAWTITRL